MASLGHRAMCVYCASYSCTAVLSLAFLHQVFHLQPPLLRTHSQFDHTDAKLRSTFPDQFCVWGFAGFDITQPVTDTLIRLPFPISATAAAKHASGSGAAQPMPTSGYASTTAASMTAGETWGPTRALEA